MFPVQVPDLIKAGVSCFKIEGRLKGPEYVALTTQVTTSPCLLSCLSLPAFSRLTLIWSSPKHFPGIV